MILLVSRDSVDLPKHRYIRDAILDENSNRVVHILCGEPKRSEWLNEDNLHYLYEGFDTFKTASEEWSPDEIITRQNRQASFVSATLYQADRRFVLGLRDEHELVLEQIFLVERVLELFSHMKPKLLFMMGGGNLVRNVPFIIGEKTEGTRCYKILNTSYLNPGRKGIRYWFCDNNNCLLPGNSIFNYTEESIYDHAETLYDTIQKQSYRLDRYARETARSNRVSGNLRSALNDLFRSIKFKNKSKGKSLLAERKYRSYKNYTLTKLFIDSSNLYEKPYFLFPLNVPEDAQLVLRAPTYRDLLSICSQISNVLPYGFNLLIKEHPGHPGMFDYGQLKQFLKKHRNIKFVPARIQLKGDLLRKSTALITINSTSGFEALIAGKPVMTLGDSFYRGHGLTVDVDKPSDLQEAINRCIADSNETSSADKARVLSIIGSILKQTIPEPSRMSEIGGDMYLSDIAEGCKTIIASSETSN